MPVKVFFFFCSDLWYLRSGYTEVLRSVTISMSTGKNVDQKLIPCLASQCQFNTSQKQQHRNGVFKVFTKTESTKR